MIKKHITEVHSSSAQKLSCDSCDCTFFSSSGLNKHRANVHNPKVFACIHCNKYFQAKELLVKHIENKHFDQDSPDASSSEESDSDENSECEDKESEENDIEFDKPKSSSADWVRQASQKNRKCKSESL